MLRRFLVLLMAVVMAAMMSMGPAFAHSGDDNDCHWGGAHWWGWKCDDDDDKHRHHGGGAGGLPGVWPLNL